MHFTLSSYYMIKSNPANKKNTKKLLLLAPVSVNQHGTGWSSVSHIGDEPISLLDSSFLCLRFLKATPATTTAKPAMQATTADMVVVLGRPSP